MGGSILRNCRGAMASRPRPQVVDLRRHHARGETDEPRIPGRGLREGRIDYQVGLRDIVLALRRQPRDSSVFLALLCTPVEQLADTLQVFSIDSVTDCLPRVPLLG